MGKKKITPQTPSKPEVEKPHVLVRCPDCPWSPGLKDETNYCDTCKGSGQVEAAPLE